MSPLGGTKGLVRSVEKSGLLLVHDRSLPSVSALVAGEPVAGSWWSHPKGREIYAALSRLEEEPSVLLVKLVAGKQTFVHRSLWPALFTVAMARDAWQMRGLGPRERALLEDVDAAGSVRIDRLASGGAEKTAFRARARVLVDRLLVYGRQVHTERGAHELELVSWKALARERGVEVSGGDAAAARATLEAKTSERLPWSTRERRRAKAR